MLKGVALSVGVFIGLGLIAQLIRPAVPGAGPLRERLDFQYAVIGLGLVGVAAGGIFLLRLAETTPSFQTQNRLLGVLAVVVGLTGATACLGALLQRRRRRQHGG